MGLFSGGLSATREWIKPPLVPSFLPSLPSFPWGRLPETRFLFKLPSSPLCCENFIYEVTERKWNFVWQKRTIGFFAACKRAILDLVTYSTSSYLAIPRREKNESADHHHRCRCIFSYRVSHPTRLFPHVATRSDAWLLRGSSDTRSKRDEIINLLKQQQRLRTRTQTEIYRNATLALVFLGGGIFDLGQQSRFLLELAVLV